LKKMNFTTIQHVRGKTRFFPSSKPETPAKPAP
jgi:hypothetical protein